MPETECECQAPGWCERHECSKSRLRYDLCRTNVAFFRMWENGGGPGQLANSKRNPAEVKPCVHLGALLGTETCHGCSGQVEIKVFECGVHGRCAIGAALPDIACCYWCEEYTRQDSVTAEDIKQG